LTRAKPELQVCHSLNRTTQLLVAAIQTVCDRSSGLVGPVHGRPPCLNSKWVRTGCPSRGPGVACPLGSFVIKTASSKKGQASQPKAPTATVTASPRRAYAWLAQAATGNAARIMIFGKPRPRGTVTYVPPFRARIAYGALWSGPVRRYVLGSPMRPGAATRTPTGIARGNVVGTRKY
jgi:hypothetical protein